MITAQNAMYQAPSTIDVYLSEGIKIIDSKLGEGYAKKHPELLASFIAACTTDFNTIMSTRFEGC